MCKTPVRTKQNVRELKYYRNTEEKVFFFNVCLEGRIRREYIKKLVYEQDLKGSFTSGDFIH